MGKKESSGLVKRDIDIPEVKDVYVAALREEHPEYHIQDWNIYIINDRELPLETVLIVSRGYDGSKSTSSMRHSISELPPKSFAKVEFLQEEVLSLNNEFSVSYFSEGKMFHKKFVFRKNTINERSLRDLPLLPKKGVLVK